MRCAKCKYWDAGADKDEKEGLCRIAPPTHLFESGRNRRALWPVTLYSDWCGAFEPKEAKDGEPPKPPRQDEHAKSPHPPKVRDRVGDVPDHRALFSEASGPLEQGEAGSPKRG